MAPSQIRPFKSPSDRAQTRSPCAVLSANVPGINLHTRTLTRPCILGSLGLPRCLARALVLTQAPPSAPAPCPPCLLPLSVTRAPGPPPPIAPTGNKHTPCLSSAGDPKPRPSRRPKPIPHCQSSVLGHCPSAACLPALCAVLACAWLLGSTVWRWFRERHRHGRRTLVARARTMSRRDAPRRPAPPLRDRWHAPMAKPAQTSIAASAGPLSFRAHARPPRLRAPRHHGMAKAYSMRANASVR